MEEIANSPWWLYGLGVLCGIVMIGYIVIIITVMKKNKK